MRVLRGLLREYLVFPPLLPLQFRARICRPSFGFVFTKTGSINSSCFWTIGGTVSGASNAHRHYLPSPDAYQIQLISSSLLVFLPSGLYLDWVEALVVGDDAICGRVHPLILHAVLQAGRPGFLHIKVTVSWDFCPIFSFPEKYTVIYSLVNSGIVENPVLSPVTSGAGVLKKLSLASLAKLSRLRYSWLRFGVASAGYRGLGVHVNPVYTAG